MVMRIFILDVPFMIIAGSISAYFYAKYLRERHPDAYTFTGLSLLLISWLNVILSNLHIIEPWFTQHMVVYVNTTIGIFYVLSYPLWFIWGGERILGLFGRSKTQGGLIWPLTLNDKTEPFKPAWSVGDTEDKI